MKYEQIPGKGTALAMGLLMLVNSGKSFLSSCVTVVASFFALNIKI